MTGLSTSITRTGSDCVVAVTGELDLATGGDLHAVISVLLVDPLPITSLTIDLYEVSFLDCSAIRRLVNIQRVVIDRGAIFSVIRARGIVARVLDLTGMGAVLGATTSRVSGPGG